MTLWTEYFSHNIVSIVWGGKYDGYKIPECMYRYLYKDKEYFSNLWNEFSDSLYIMRMQINKNLMAYLILKKKIFFFYYLWRNTQFFKILDKNKIFKLEHIQDTVWYLPCLFVDAYTHVNIYIILKIHKTNSGYL